MKKQSQDSIDIVGVLTKIQEQLVLLDKKMDILANRALSVPPEVIVAPKPVPQPVHTHVQNVAKQENRFQVQAGARRDDRPRDRVMHKSICADCKKDCEVPFKPSGDRPVYCKECFSKRKGGNVFKSPIENKPKEIVAPPILPYIEQPPVSEKKNPVTKKKPVAKKKPVVKKKPAAKKRK